MHVISAFLLYASLAGNISGTTTDATSGQPLPSVEISVSQNGRVVFNTSTSDFGRFAIHNLDAGTYTVSAHFIGYRPESNDVVVGSDEGATARVDFAMTSVPTSLATM